MNVDPSVRRIDEDIVHRAVLANLHGRLLGPRGEGEIRERHARLCDDRAFDVHRRRDAAQRRPVQQPKGTDMERPLTERERGATADPKIPKAPGD